MSRTHRLLVLGLVAASAGLFPACRSRLPRVRNVVLISIDTLRADRVSAYGFPRPTTPHIDALARDGVLFRNVYSPVPVTLPAHCSMLTGTLPPVHGVRDNLHERLPDSSLTLAEVVKPKGITTGAIVSAVVLDRRFNLGQGFDTYDDRMSAGSKIGGVAERRGDETTRAATQWLDAHASEPFFLFVHYYDPHDPYEPPEPFSSRFAEDGYAGEVAFADHGVGQVLETLEKHGLDDKTLVIVTGDHGEMLGEHGELNHGFFIYESALRVPLVIRAPGRKAPRQVDEPASLIDIVPTVASLLGIEAPKAAQGVDLSPWLTGEAGRGRPRPLYAETITATRYYGAGSLLGIIGEGWKYIETTRPELYDLNRDPAETRNLFSTERHRADALGRQLASIVTAGARRGEAAGLDEETRQRLEALGYLSRGRSEAASLFDRSKEDPKDLIAFFRQDQQLSRFVEEKKYAEARALCDRMLRQRPGFADCHMQMSRIAAGEGDAVAALAAANKAVALAPRSATARIHLAGLLRGRGDVDGALAHYREAAEAEPASVEASAALGRLLADKGRFGEAESILRMAAASHPESGAVAVQLGFALAKQGRLPEAVENYRRALAIDPESTEAHAYLGSALAGQGNLDEAVAHFDRALRTKPGSAELHDRIGVALREKGRIGEAVDHFREATRLEPGLAIAHFNLGRALRQRGALDEAVEHYRRALALDPHLAAAHNSLGSALGSQGRLREAVRSFREAVRLAPDDAEAHNNLGLALRTLGQWDEALRHFEAALRLRPEWAVPMNETAWILATHPDPRARNPEKSVRLAERATETTSGQQPVILDTLAAAYAARGDFDRAAATAQKASAMAVSAGSARLAGDIGKRLDLYRQKKAFREPSRR